MKVLSLFSGIGAFEKALNRIGVSFELVNYCEIDKYASKSYAAVHGVSENLNLHDVTKVDTDKLQRDIDLITYGFPCQDISIAGKQKGILSGDIVQLLHDMNFTDSEIADLAKWIGESNRTDDEIKYHLFDKYGLSGCECDELIENGVNGSTRSGLFFQALRIIEKTKPKIAIAENVKNLTSKKFNAQFQIVLESLEQAGYNNYWQVLNAKDYGVPQNRERVFIVSIRKDIDNGCFVFPEPFELKLRLKDLLESEVDEKFYLSKKFMDYVTVNDAKQREKGNGFRFAPTDGSGTAKAIRTGTNNKMDDNFIVEPQVKQIGNCCPTKTRDNPNQGRIYDTEGLSPALNCMGGGNRQPCIPVLNPVSGGSGNIPKVIEGECAENLINNISDDYSFVREKAKDILKETGELPEMFNPYNKSEITDIAPTQTACCNRASSSSAVIIISKDNAVKEESVTDSTQQELSKERFFRQEQETLIENECNYGDTIDAFNKRVNKSELCPTLTTRPEGFKTAILPVTNDLRIRKLTPLECWRLMGFDDEDFYKAEKVNSNSQLYKQAGNSIVVDVLMAIFDELRKANFFN